MESLRPYGIAKLVFMACLLLRGNCTTFEQLELTSRKLADMFVDEDTPQNTNEGTGE